MWGAVVWLTSVRADQVKVMWCEVVGKMTRRRLVKVVINIEVALLMYGLINSPGRSVYFFTPFIRLLIEVIASIEIDFAEVRHVLTTVAVRSQSRPWLANSMSTLQLFVVKDKESVVECKISIGNWIRCV